MNIRLIRNDDDHAAALAEIESLWRAPDNSERAAKRDLLVILVENYEERRWPIDEPDWDPIDLLHYAIDELGHTQSELAELLGSRSRASEVLSRRRALTVDMVHKIGTAWKVPTDLLVRPYAVEANRASPRTRARA